MNKAFKATLFGAALALTSGGLAFAAPAAHAATQWSGTTTITNDAAVGGDGEIVASTNSSYSWAIDGFKRTLTVTIDNNTSDCNAVTSGPAFDPLTDTCFTATIADTGTAVTRPGAFQPNQGSSINWTSQVAANGNGNKMQSPAETVPFQGSSSYLLFTATSNGLPDAANIAPSVDYGNLSDSLSPTSQDQTQQWYKQAFSVAVRPSVYGIQRNDWTWTYGSNGCEQWTDSFANNNGQSSPILVSDGGDGNITGAVCIPPTPTPTPTPTPPVTITLGSYGNNVNPFGNGFDVFRQHAAWNNPIVGWPATQHDPATHFLKEAEGAHFRFEYAPNGVGDGLCVSNPGNGALVLRGCNANVWQQFDYAGGHIISVVNGGIVNPDGTGAQLTTGSSATPWGGSHYTWTAFSSLPA